MMGWNPSLIMFHQICDHTFVLFFFFFLAYYSPLVYLTYCFQLIIPKAELIMVILMHSISNFFWVSQICFIHCQLFQETLILLSIQVTLAGRSIWLIPSLLLVIFSFA